MTTFTSLSSLLIIVLTGAYFTATNSQNAAVPSPATTFSNCNRAFSCGIISNITFPFTGGDRPSYCGLPEFALTCRDDSITELTHKSLTYRVLQLNQTQKNLILSRSDLYNSTCPSEFYNTTLNSSLIFDNGPQNEDLNLFYGCNTSAMTIRPSNLFSCSSSGLNFTDAYRIIGPVPSDPILSFLFCSVSIKVPILRDAANRLTGLQLSLREALMQGFSVNYSDPYERLCSECSRLGGQCGFNSGMGQLVCICDDRPCPFAVTLPPEASPNSYEGKSITKVILALGGVIAVTILFVLMIWKKNGLLNLLGLTGAKTENQKDIEDFLKNNGNLAPRRYKYSELIKITKSFSDKLGKGGYGTVYKGKLQDGSLVAVKILNESEGNGEEFMNEVASISRTSHVNIVTLLGFCFEGSRIALIYEFLPNGSLEKYRPNTYASSTASLLGWEKLFEIVVGIARGLEYLHQGCNMRILHFDIKPHNILLDKDLKPKISDFGLAKLCPNRSSIVSMQGARGTAGYIAPEVFCRNFGQVSHKSDVYSYGMMVLEMALGRKNIEPQADQSSEMYFPDWIYKNLEQNVETSHVDGILVEGDELQLAKRKLIIIGLWCTQTEPKNRPSISRVIEMLEGKVESLQVPPRSYSSSPPRSITRFSASDSI